MTDHPSSPHRFRSQHTHTAIPVGPSTTTDQTTTTSSIIASYKISHFWQDRFWELNSAHRHKVTLLSGCCELMWIYLHHAITHTAHYSTNRCPSTSHFKETSHMAVNFTFYIHRTSSMYVFPTWFQHSHPQLNGLSQCCLAQRLKLKLILSQNPSFISPYHHQHQHHPSHVYIISSGWHSDWFNILQSLSPSHCFEVWNQTPCTS